MLYSILIAAYNVENYICECLDSVLGQEFKDYEIIIIDDGSTDNTGEICDSYAERNKNIRVMHWENHGLVLSRRKAVELARGEYIIFIDADDKHVENSLEILDQIRRKTDADTIVFRFRFVYEDGTWEDSRDFGEFIYEKENLESLFSDFIKHYEYNHLWCKMIKRSVILKDSTDYYKMRHVKMGEDLLQSIYVYYYSNKTFISNQVLYNYRVLGSSMSHVINENQIKDIETVYSELFFFLTGKFPNNTELLKEAKCQLAIRLAGLLRSLWSSDISMPEMKRISNRIIFVFKKYDLLHARNHIVRRNWVLVVLVTCKRWNIAYLYSKFLRAGRTLNELAKNGKAAIAK